MDTVTTCVFRALALPMVWVDSDKFAVDVNSDMYNPDFLWLLLLPVITVITTCY